MGRGKYVYFFTKGCVVCTYKCGIDGRTLTKTVSGFGVPYKRGDCCNIFYPEDDCLTLVRITIDIILVGGM